MVEERVSRFPRGATLKCPVCGKTGSTGQITGHCGKAKGCKGSKPEVVSYPPEIERVAVPISHPTPAPAAEDEPSLAADGAEAEQDADVDSDVPPREPPAEPEVLDYRRLVEQPRPRGDKGRTALPERGRMARATTDGCVHADLYLLPTTNALIAIVAEDRGNFPFVAEPRNPSQVVDALVELALRTGDPVAEYELGLIRRPRVAL